MEDFQAQLARANNVIQLLQNQRNNAQNECINMGAELLDARKRIQELEAKLIKATEGNNDGH